MLSKSKTLSCNENDIAYIPMGYHLPPPDEILWKEMIKMVPKNKTYLKHVYVRKFTSRVPEETKPMVLTYDVMGFPIKTPVPVGKSEGILTVYYQ